MILACTVQRIIRDSPKTFSFSLFETYEIETSIGLLNTFSFTLSRDSCHGKKLDSQKVPNLYEYSFWFDP